MIEDILKDAKIRMGKTAESLENDLSRMRTGRAHPSLLESVKVDYYGAESPLSQVANITPKMRACLLSHRGNNPWCRLLKKPS